jgi:hypothetical protein
MLGWFSALSMGRKLLAILAPILIIAALVGLVLLYGHSKYDAGHEAGVAETDAKWVAAAEKTRQLAAKSATRADDAAVKRLEQFKAQEDADRKAIDDANANGTSPLDAIFGN